eukprot:CAMPEP_0185037684 /NCGR_PEP_ID=MMETSP1103-20130426/32436_1 /TAXON_ID=36769 /ORGANISM="Paraphysomonas bandaiensis, Strain Caron Lab Isolate" /LENGTH=715 /DNA_ID=CAMNT_0027575783 /DNA_START=415 /DNA_END=2562 /DNA_ORIENTATION=-
MREVSLDFDGRAIVNPPIDYSGWDADAIMGCICDEGYEGYDCSFRSCPIGRDPTSTGPSQEEQFVMRCQADAGYFSVTMLGRVTQAIPHNATPAALQFLMQQVYPAGRVRVRMQSLAGDDQPSACGISSPVTTSIWFLDYIGDRPPIRVSYNDTANTRMWPDGATSLTLGGSTPTLEMLTVHTLTCPPCPSCQGKVYFTFKDSLSTGIGVNDPDAPTLIAEAIENLSDLVNMEWPNLAVEVTSPTSTTTICDSAVTSTMQISLVSDIGNLPFLEIYDSTLVSYGIDVPVNVTFSTNGGVGDMYECSNHGFCDRTSGVCVCHDKFVGGAFDYRAESSDGQGALGGRGDCGFLDVTNPVCGAVGEDKCNGHGFCAVIGDPCVCQEGWYGYDCRVGSCPMGRAWFDEAISSTEAHQLTECSSMGMCDRQTGLCNCNTGYSGDACQYMDCPLDSSTGKQCGGHGWCLNMNEIAAIEGLEYGDVQDIRAFPDTWDAFKIYHCLCSAYTTGGFKGHKIYPTVASKGMVSGLPAMTRNLMGWTGWQCTERNCPVGERVTSRCDRGLFEKQRVVCSNESGAFTLTLYGVHETDTITAGMTAAEIKSAIEIVPSIGNVSITFENSNYDFIENACNSTVNTTHGGFTVTFLTDLGDIPLMQSDDDDVDLVEESVAGTIDYAECGGYEGGYCDRATGDCKCFANYGSSNGTNNPGDRGDCSYFYPY